MLVENKSIKINDVISAKLITGEEILAKVIGVESNGYTISKPFTLIVSQNGIGMIPFMLCVETDKLFLDNTKIIVIGKAVKDATDEYISKTSNIKIAQPGDLAGLRNI